MKNVFNEVHKWVFSNIHYFILAIVLVVAVVYITVTKARTTDTLNTLKDNAEEIFVLVQEQTATIKSLTEERSLLQEKVEKLKAKRVQEKENIKNYILTYYKTVAPIIAEETAVHILEKSAKHNVPFVAVVAVTEVESHFNPFAISSKGARGSMQIMPRFWLKEFKLPNKYALHDIETNIDCGVKVLRRYLDATDNNMRKALFKYVGGSHPYIKQVYESMGKFIVFKSFSDIKVSEEENEKSMTDTKTKVDNEAIEVKAINKTKTNISFTHTIKKGQTLGLLAQWYTGSVYNWRKILEANPTIIPNKMQIGISVVIPTNLLKNTTPLQ